MIECQKKRERERAVCWWRWKLPPRPAGFFFFFLNTRTDEGLAELRFESFLTWQLKTRHNFTRSFPLHKLQPISAYRKGSLDCCFREVRVWIRHSHALTSRIENVTKKYRTSLVQKKIYRSKEIIHPRRPELNTNKPLCQEAKNIYNLPLPLLITIVLFIVLFSSRYWSWLFGPQTQN